MKPTREQRKPTDLETLKIAMAFCRLQLGFTTCKGCPSENMGCTWFRERIITQQAVAFAINEWEKIRGAGK